MRKLLSIIILAAATISILAENRTMFVHHDGTMDPIFYAEVDSMRVSCIALDSTRTSLPTVQEIWTPDSVYRFEIASIDSITFQTPKAIPLPDAIDLAGDLAPYIESCTSREDASTGYPIILKLKSNTPSNLIPGEGSLLYQAEPSERLPYGFAGVVQYNYNSNDPTELMCDFAEPETMFESLSWTSETQFIPDVAESNKRRINLPVLGSNLTYPDLIEGVITMTDELKDIPAGPEQAKIDGKIRVNPNVHAYTGSYVYKNHDGSYTCRRRLFTKIEADIKASIRGRENVKELSTVDNSGAKMTFDYPIGFGNKGILTYTGSMKLHGKMGLDYLLEYSTEASTLSDIIIQKDEYGYLDMLTSHSYNHKQMEVPVHKLEASMDGEATLTASISVTVAKNSDFNGTVTNVFSYGARLKGQALFLKSEIEDAAEDNALYQRITATGITTTPIESITASINYGDIKYRRPMHLPKPVAVTFYAVPCLASPTYNDATGIIRYNTMGTPMTFSKSRLGAAVQHNDGNFIWTSTNYVWPGNASASYEAAVDFDLSKGETIYPTVTLPEGQRILASPAYPTVCNQLLPITSYQETDGIIMTSGSPFTGSAVSGNHGVYVGTIIPVK